MRYDADAGVDPPAALIGVLESSRVEYWPYEPIAENLVLPPRLYYDDTHLDDDDYASGGYGTN